MCEDMEAPKMWAILWIPFLTKVARRPSQSVFLGGAWAGQPKSEYAGITAATDVFFSVQDPSNFAHGASQSGGSPLVCL